MQQVLLKMYKMLKKIFHPLQLTYPSKQLNTIHVDMQVEEGWSLKCDLLCVQTFLELKNYKGGVLLLSEELRIA